MLTLTAFVGSFFLLLLTGRGISEQEVDPDYDYGYDDYTSEEKLADNHTSKYTTSPSAGSGESDSGLQKIEEKVFYEPDEEMSENCSYRAVLNHLNLKSSGLGRPVRQFRTVTKILFIMRIISVLDVREVDQVFISHIRVHMFWIDEFIQWNFWEFCGIQSVKVPREWLWQPDLTIEEMVEKDKATESPYVDIMFFGAVKYYNDQVVVSTCKMHVYRFPFDVQRCTLSFRSTIYGDRELWLNFNPDSEKVTNASLKVMHTQYEWLFLKMTVTNKTDDSYIGYDQTIIIHTIYMKRKSVLYIANFIVPILFFLCLDLSSFLISDSGGEKLSFKVTVMLAVTVMQLILNDILPSSSDKIPLIVVFCIGIFGLMMLSLLETILVMHLVEKDAASQNNEAIRDLNLNRSKQSCFKEVKKCANCASVSDDSTDSTDQTPSNTKEDSSSQLMDVSLALGKVSTELEEIEKTMTAISGEKKEKRSDYWTGVAKQINKVFVTFYITAAGVFLTVIFYLWGSSDEDH